MVMNIFNRRININHKTLSPRRRMVTYDTGAAYLLTDSIQLDAAFSRAANRNTPNFSWTLGISAKF